MSHLEFKCYDGLGKVQLKNYNYSQSVRIGEYVYISGQGGWDPTVTSSLAFREGVVAQIEQAFDNVRLALEDAGASMEHVFKMVTYTVPHGPESQEAIVKTTKRVFPNHSPLWTDLGVKSLGAEGMLVEIEVVAHVPPKP